MNQSELTARVAEAEAQLGQPLPADYRAFLLDADEDTMVWKYFTDSESYVGTKVDWTQDFPFSLEHPVDDSPLKEIYERAVYADEVENDIDKYDAIEEEASNFMVEHFLKPMERGIVYVAEGGCAIYSFLVLRGEAAGQMWWCELDSFYATIKLHLHPDTNEPLSFTQWCHLR